jgi:hypothetical protein
MWRKGVRLEATGPHKEAQSVVWTPRSQAEGGLRLRTPQGDGLWETKEVAGRQAAAPADWEGGRSFLYFDVNDSFAYDVPGKAYVLEVEFHDTGGGFAVHYDSAEFDSGAVGGSFRSTERVGAGGEGWRAVEAPLVAARFANRANQADFRIVPAASGEGFAVSRLELRPVRTDPQ